MDNNIKIYIDNNLVDLSSSGDIDINISYKLEDKQNFTTKKGSDSLGIKLPSSNLNDRIANTYYNPGIEDLTANQSYRGIRNSKISINNQEFLVGKAFLQQIFFSDRSIGYEYDFYGNNSDWMIDLKDSTLYDFLKPIQFIFTKQNIINSWQFDGTNENLPYVFAPVKYGKSMEKFPSIVTGVDTEDYNMKPEYMKPSISKYWIIYWAFKSLGYSIKSDFFDSPYFRRQVMPWTWGNFLDSDGTRLDVLRFLAKSSESVFLYNQSYTGFFDVKATNDTINGAYDNSDTYSYDSINKTMNWSYPTLPNFNFGLLEVTFYLNMFINAVATANSDVELRIQWFKNNIRIIGENDNGNGSLLINLNAPAIGRREYNGPVESFFTTVVNQGDTISAKIYLHTFKSNSGIARITASVDSFNIEYFKIPLGGTINFENFLSLKKYKFLDFFGGVIDEFDISLQTNSINKTIHIEPTHSYSTVHDLSIKHKGYFNENLLDWSNKLDLSKQLLLEPFTDSERELLFQYKDDPNDGTLKKVQDRNTLRVGLAKYVFPERFASGQKEIENRFFSTTMHYDVKQWAYGFYEAPQMVILSPENISNLSREEAQNTFLPKSTYYKGLTSDYKWIFDGEDTHPYPFLFAVNYKIGGENDPILSYSDEIIGTVTGKGLLRRFFYQRLNIMRNGQYLTAYFNLNLNDISNFLHREFIIWKNQMWELIQLDYSPLSKESTKCLLKKWTPII